MLDTLRYTNQTHSNLSVDKARCMNELNGMLPAAAMYRTSWFGPLVTKYDQNLLAKKAQNKINFHFHLHGS